MLVRPSPIKEQRRGKEIDVPDFEIAQRRLQSEITRSPVANQVPIPEVGGMEAAKAFGDIFLVDLDNTGEKGAFAWITATPDWKNPTQLWQHHAWGPSERHLDILIDICQWVVDHAAEFRFPIADLPVSYMRSPHPMTRIADQFAAVKISDDNTTSTTTYRTALAALKQRREAVRATPSTGR